MSLLAAQPLEAGFRLKDRYQIVRVLRLSGLGAIYEARDLSSGDLSQVVTIKETLLDSTIPYESSDLERFPERYQLIKTLHYPLIPRTFDYFILRGRVYQVMEYIKGRDVEDTLLNGDPLPIEAVHQWALDLCDVLHYLHSHPLGAIIYRDMKPSNLMIDQKLRIRLIDFGIAGIFPKGWTDNPLGTDGYAAPEQYKGVCTPAIDLFGLGATLHHMLSGVDPRLELPFAMVTVSVRKYNPQVSEGFAEVIQHSMKMDPKLRFGSAEEMKAALEAVKPI